LGADTSTSSFSALGQAISACFFQRKKTFPALPQKLRGDLARFFSSSSSGSQHVGSWQGVHRTPPISFSLPVALLCSKEILPSIHLYTWLMMMIISW